MEPPGPCMKYAVSGPKLLRMLKENHTSFSLQEVRQLMEKYEKSCPEVARWRQMIKEKI